MKQDKMLRGAVIIVVAGMIVIIAFSYWALSRPAPTMTMEAVPLVLDPDANQTLYGLNPDETEARFVLNEVLRGVDTEVVGGTNFVSGQLAFNLDDLSTAEIGPIHIAASGFLTDNNFRNTAIRNDILFADLYPLIVFEPTDISGLPVQVALNEPITFTVTGDLTIRDITQTESFDVTATAVSPTRIEGSAATIIQRADYQIAIPSVPNVANVDEAVRLELDFVATAVPATESTPPTE